MTSETAFIFRSRHRIDKYSYLIWLLVVKNIKNKYRRSFLGVFWTVLLPLMEMLVMTMIFSHVNGDIDSRVFIMCGIVVFGFNREATSGAIGSVLGARGLIDRVYIPTIIFPLANTFSALANMLFSTIALLFLMLITGFPITWHFVLILINIPALIMFCAGISIVLSSIYVYFRDIGQLYGIFLQLWTFVSGVYMSVESFPDFAQSIVKLNPMYYFVNNFRSLVMFQTIPSLNNYLLCLAMGVVSLAIGCIIFRLLKKNFILYI